MLYPYENNCREVNRLNGLWDFEIPSKSKDMNITKQITVLSSYNDLFCDTDIKNHVGTVIYKKEFWPHLFGKIRIYLLDLVLLRTRILCKSKMEKLVIF